MYKNEKTSSDMVDIVFRVCGHRKLDKEEGGRRKWVHDAIREFLSESEKTLDTPARHMASNGAIVGWGISGETSEREATSIELFLKELRESADVMYRVFTSGSCFRLFRILKTVYPEAVPYWSDRESHCITKIDGKFYDIGGVISQEYIRDFGYYEIPESRFDGYSLLRWAEKEDHAPEVRVEKYTKPGEQ